MPIHIIRLLAQLLSLSVVSLPAGETGQTQRSSLTATTDTHKTLLTPVRLVGNPRPEYPREARTNGMQGEVMLWLQISETGQVLHARIRNGSTYALLDDATLRFAGSLRFEPARYAGIPIASEVYLPIRYRLVDRAAASRPSK